MKNKHGMTRSKEFMKSSGAESKTSHEKNESPAEKKAETKELHHMRVHPADAKGVVKVTHHAGAEAASHAEHTFDEHEGEELVNHLMAHAGVPYDSEGGGEHYSDEKEEVEA